MIKNKRGQMQPMPDVSVVEGTPKKSNWMLWLILAIALIIVIVVVVMLVFGGSDSGGGSSLLSSVSNSVPKPPAFPS